MHFVLFYRQGNRDEINHAKAIADTTPYKYYTHKQTQTHIENCILSSDITAIIRRSLSHSLSLSLSLPNNFHHTVQIHYMYY